MEDLKDRYEIIEEAATDAIVTLDEDGTILSISKAAERIFGFNVSDMAGKPIEIIVPQYKRFIREARSEGANIQVVEVPGRHKSGKEIQLELSFGEYNKGNRHFYTSVIRDLALRRDADRRLAAQYAVTRALAESTS